MKSINVIITDIHCNDFGIWVMVELVPVLRFMDFMEETTYNTVVLRAEDIDMMCFSV